jgi:hypothetical protein
MKMPRKHIAFVDRRRRNRRACTMPLMTTTTISIAGATALILYVWRRRARGASLGSLSDARGGQVVASDPIRTSAVDLFLFEKSFGWEFARLLFATLPVALSLLAVLWLMRSAP